MMMRNEIYEKKKKKEESKAQKTARRIKDLDKTVKKNVEVNIERILKSDASSKKKSREINQTLDMMNVQGKEREKFVENLAKEIEEKEAKRENFNEVLRRLRKS